MKRTAAIIGPTPAFVRWAIRHACPFRELTDQGLPYQTFRQLRSLREISIGSAQDRIVDGFCLHPEFSRDAHTARGFPVEEVLALYGSHDQIGKECGNCPANAARSSNDQGNSRLVWAGCYGWFRSAENNVNLIPLFDNAARGLAIPDWLPVNAARVWYRVWQNQVWNGEQLEYLQDLTNGISSQAEFSSDMEDFLRAIGRCRDHGLDLVTELIPSGDSDGLTWTIEPHCLDCRCEMSKSSTRCSQCNRVGQPVPANRRKVLGLRPYMLLKEIIGSERTVELIQSLDERRRA